MTIVRQRYQLFPFRDINDQRILESDWSQCIPGHTQSRAVVLDATFPWWLSPCKKWNTPIASFKFYCWSKNPSIWMRDIIGQKQLKSNSLKCYLPQLFHDGDCYPIETSPLICRANQWTGFNKITTSVMKELTNFSMKKPLCLLDHRYWWLKNPAIWLDETQNWRHPIKRGSLTYYPPWMIISMEKI